MVNSKKIKLTVIGSSGFLGSNFIEVLNKKKYEIIAFDLHENTQSKYKNFKFIKGDILDNKMLEKAIKGSDYVFNFAGQADISENIDQVENTFKSNLIGNNNILKICVKHKIKKYILYK